MSNSAESNIPETAVTPSENVFVSDALSNVLGRTHAAANEIVKFSDIEASEVGVRALLRAGNVLRWFRS